MDLRRIAPIIVGIAIAIGGISIAASITPGAQKIIETMTTTVPITHTIKETVTTPITITVEGPTITITQTRTITTTVEKTVTETVTKTVTPMLKKEDLIIQGVTDRINMLGWLEINGEVFNNSSVIAKFVRVYATFYDVENKVIKTSMSYTTPSDIPPKQAAPFTITVIEKEVVAKITRYKLVVESGS